MNKDITSNDISTFAAHLSDIQPQSSSLISWFSYGWTYFIHYFTKSREPRVWQERSAAGDIYHCAYDPYSGRSAYLSSDTDLRAWLEQLPYQ